MLKFLSFVAVLLVASSASVPSFATEEETECHGNAGYLIVGYERDGGYQDFLVKRRSSPSQDVPCEAVRGPEDFVISELDKTHTDDNRIYRFIALKDDLLVVEREEGSASTTSYLLMVDLKARASDDSIGSYHGVEGVDDSGVSFWVATDIKPTRRNCPKDYKYDGSAKYEHAQAFIMQKVKLDFASRKIVPSPSIKCEVLAD